ncbi:hypothetical protein SprV_0301346100 [Sparganum proliferum]
MLRREAEPSWACWTTKSTTSHGSHISPLPCRRRTSWIAFVQFSGCLYTLGFCRVQQPGEGVLDYQQALRLLGRRAFPTTDATALSQRVLEQFIVCVGDPEVRKALMREQPAALYKALDIARQEEALQAVCDRPAQPLLGIVAVRPQTVHGCGTQTPRRPCSCGSYYPRQNQWRLQPPCRVPGPQTRRPFQGIDFRTEEHGGITLFLILLFLALVLLFAL